MIDELGPTYSLHPLLAGQQWTEMEYFTWSRDLTEPPKEKPVLPHGPSRDPQIEAKLLHEIPKASSVMPPPPGCVRLLDHHRNAVLATTQAFSMPLNVRYPPPPRDIPFRQLCQRTACRTSLAMGITF